SISQTLVASDAIHLDSAHVVFGNNLDGAVIMDEVMPAHPDLTKGSAVDMAHQLVRPQPVSCGEGNSHSVLLSSEAEEFSSLLPPCQRSFVVSVARKTFGANWISGRLRPSPDHPIPTPWMICQKVPLR